MSERSEIRELRDHAAIEQALDRMADEVVSTVGGDLRLVGIRRGGVPLAHRLAERIRQRVGTAPPVGEVDITLYRDDLDAHPVPQVGPTRIPFAITGRPMVLVDDVLYTGRTVRAALDQISDFGRPSRIFLAVLAERPGRELPVQPDFVGFRLEARPDERIEVLLDEEQGDRIVVQRWGGT